MALHVVVCGSALIRSPITRLFSLPALAAIGRISYGIYLWQQLFTGTYPGAGPLHYMAGTALIFLISWLSYRFMEMPLIAMGSRISNHLRDSAARPMAPTPPTPIS